MAIRSEALRALLAAGATPEMLIAVIEADERAEAQEVDAKTEKRRAQTAARVRRHRETHRNASNGGNALPPAPSPDGRPSPPAPPHPTLNPSPAPGSDPDGSAGDAGQAGDGEDDGEEARSVRRDLLTIGMDLISANTGRSRRSARALIGHWLGIARDEAAVVLNVIEEADGRELADFSTWVTFQLRKRRAELDRPPDWGPHFDGPRGGGRRAPTPATVTGLAGHLVRLHEQSMTGAFDVEPPTVDANSPGAEPSRGQDFGTPWQAGSGGRPADALLRAAGQGGHDSRASSAVRRRRAG